MIYWRRHKVDAQDPARGKPLLLPSVSVKSGNVGANVKTDDYYGKWHKDEKEHEKRGDDIKIVVPTGAPSHTPEEGWRHRPLPPIDLEQVNEGLRKWKSKIRKTKKFRSSSTETGSSGVGKRNSGVVVREPRCSEGRACSVKPRGLPKRSAPLHKRASLLVCQAEQVCRKCVPKGVELPKIEPVVAREIAAAAHEGDAEDCDDAQGNNGTTPANTTSTSIIIATTSTGTPASVLPAPTTNGTTTAAAPPAVTASSARSYRAASLMEAALVGFAAIFLLL